MSLIEPRIDIPNWQETDLTLGSQEVVGGLEHVADFDAYSNKLGRQMLGLYNFQDPERAVDFTDEDIVTSGDLKRERPHIKTPPSIEEIFAKSGIDLGFSLTNLRVANFMFRGRRFREYANCHIPQPTHLRTAYITDASFLAIASLAPKSGESPVSVAAVHARMELKHAPYIRRTVSKSVALAPSGNALYPRSLPLYC